MIEVDNRRGFIYPVLSTGQAPVFLGWMADISRLRPLRTIDNLKFDLLSFFQRSKSVTTNCGVVYENVVTPFTFNKPITLGVIEPLDLACITHRSSSLLALDVSFETQKKTASAASTNALTKRQWVS